MRKLKGSRRGEGLILLLALVVLGVGLTEAEDVRGDGLPGVGGTPSADGLLVTAALPPAPETLAPLEIDGFSPSLHVGPTDTSWPKPVMLFLHGINADVAEQCGQWKVVGRSYGWLLCLRGNPEPGTTRAQGRWTHRNWSTANREIEAALAALEARYPGRVTRDKMILAGYSRGAILAPKLVLAAPGRYRYLFLAEGGMDQMKRVGVSALQSHGVEGVALAMGTIMRRRRAQQLLPDLKRAGLKAVYIDMPGAGHRIGEAFPVTGRSGLLELVGSP